MAIVNGIVNGNVYNRGGDIEIYGKIWGHVNGPAFIDAEAMIKGAVET
ncbi:hypothetical protein KKI24_08460 [bacterium]|nr:hypothetical protein [bacterium]